MHGSYVPRRLEKSLHEALNESPAVAILGPRQAGKTTLAKAVLKSYPGALYLDLERPSDLRKLSDPELFLTAKKENLVCLDEIQRTPELFPLLRSLIDEDRHPGRFLMLGSASPSLLRQSSESLAGRLSYLELTPFLFSEVASLQTDILVYLLSGGFPPAFLAGSAESSARWRENFIRTFLERDIPQLGFSIPAKTLERLWTMCAHVHGQPLRQSQLGQALGLSHTTIRSYLDILSITYMVRLLPPCLPNIKKRLVKSPRLYVRDSGTLHELLSIRTLDDLMGHPVFGASWEGMILENLLASLPGWKASYYRAASGAEIDFVLEKGSRRVGVECKASTSPRVQRGFWTALSDLGIGEAYVIAPVREAYPISKGVSVAPLLHVVNLLKP